MIEGVNGIGTVTIEDEPFFIYDESDCYIDEDDETWKSDLEASLGTEEYEALSKYELDAMREADAQSYMEDMEEDLNETLTAVMRDIQGGPYPYMKWCGIVNNFGWLHRDGTSQFSATTGRELLQHVLPNTQCTFKLYRCTDQNGNKGIVINNAHHDAPMGGEMYYIFEDKGDNDEE